MYHLWWGKRLFLAFIWVSRLVGSVLGFPNEGFGIVVGGDDTEGMGGYCTTMGVGARVSCGGYLLWEEMDPIRPFVECNITAMI